MVNCVEENEGGEVEAFDFVCKLAGSVENVCLIVEEVDTYATPNVIPFELKRLLKVGRHFGVSMLFVSRRPAEIHRLITSQSQRFICFRMIEPNDVRYMTSIIGEAARELPDLPMLHFIDWQHGQIEKGVITFGRENSKAHQAAIEESDQSRAGKNHESSLSRKSENGVGGSMEQVKEKA